jgi:hypothetical protein
MSTHCNLRLNKGPLKHTDHETKLLCLKRLIFVSPLLPFIFFLVVSLLTSFGFGSAFAGTLGGFTPRGRIVETPANGYVLFRAFDHHDRRVPVIPRAWFWFCPQLA